jgi:hypothetical protein
MEQILEGLLAIQENVEAYNKNEKTILQELKSWQEEIRSVRRSGRQFQNK